ncbi:MAG: dTDP-4-dehydrorhamnose reductase [Holophagales bacterium]|nr:dTDP-4-dehydrorhamnose reductase [Holophagales bacterium]
MNIIVSGASGQLAEAIRRHWQKHFLIMPPESELNLTSRESIQSTIQKYKPDVFVNCAAYTNVDAAEADAEQAFLVNAKAVQWIAEECNGTDTLLVQISTDYIFDGLSKSPYIENDLAKPCNVYGQSKFEGEIAALTSKKCLLFRTAWLYDTWGKNFFTTMLKLASQGKPLRIVDDQHGSPTSCRALARQLLFAVENQWRGLFNATCSGETTWYGFADAIFKKLNLTPNYSACNSSEYPTPVKRPVYSVLDNSKRKLQGPDLMGNWEDALEEL